MLIIRLIRNFVAILKSAQTPREIAVGVVLGMFAGLAPLGVHSVMLLTLSMVLACSFSGFLYSFFLFKLFTVTVSPIGYAVGYVVLQWLPMDWLWSRLVELPFVGLCGFHRYTLLGSYLLSGLLTAPVYLGTIWAIKKYRGPYSEFIEELWLYKKMKSFFLLRWLRWLLLGGESRFQLPTEEKWLLFHYLRKPVLLFLPFVFAGSWMVMGMAISWELRSYTEREATRALGTTVQVGKASFNIFSGIVRLRDVVVKDPMDDSRDILRLHKTIFDVDLWTALSGRLRSKELIVHDLDFVILREADGSLNLDNPDDGRDDAEYRAWLKEEGISKDWIALFRRYLQHLQQPLHKAERDAKAFDWNEQGGSLFERHKPWILVDLVKIDGLQIRVEDVRPGNRRVFALRDSEVNLRNLSSNPYLSGRPWELDMKAALEGVDESLYALQADWEFQDDTSKQSMTWTCTGMDLALLSGFVQDWLPVNVRSGRGAISVSVIHEENKLHGLGLVSTMNLDLRAKGKTQWPGLSSEASSQTLTALKQLSANQPLAVSFPLRGSVRNLDLNAMFDACLREIQRTASPSLLSSRSALQDVLDALPEPIKITSAADLKEFAARLSKVLQNVRQEQSNLTMEEQLLRMDKAVAALALKLTAE